MIPSTFIIQFLKQQLSLNDQVVLKFFFAKRDRLDYGTETDCRKNALHEAIVRALSQSDDESLKERLSTIQNTINQREENKNTYDDSIVRQMIECIKVHHDGKLEIIFGGGYTMEEYLITKK